MPTRLARDLLAFACHNRKRRARCVGEERGSKEYEGDDASTRVARDMAPITAIWILLYSFVGEE